MKIRSGFSLVELLSAVIIIGIISIVSVPVYRGYVKRGMETEAKTMLAELNAAEEVYYVRNKEYYNPGTTLISSNTLLGVDFSRNKYFRQFKVSGTPTTTAIYLMTNSSQQVTYRQEHVFCSLAESLSAGLFYAFLLTPHTP